MRARFTTRWSPRQVRPGRHGSTTPGWPRSGAAAVTWRRSIGPRRLVIDQVCLVPDVPAFFEAIAAWDERHFFPILIDEPAWTLPFLRAFRPSRVVRYAGRRGSSSANGTESPKSPGDRLALCDLRQHLFRRRRPTHGVSHPLPDGATRIVPVARARPAVGLRDMRAARLPAAGTRPSATSGRPRQDAVQRFVALLLASLSTGAVYALVAGASS